MTQQVANPVAEKAAINWSRVRRIWLCAFIVVNVGIMSAIVLKRHALYRQVVSTRAGVNKRIAEAKAAVVRMRAQIANFELQRSAAEAENRKLTKVEREQRASERNEMKQTLLDITRRAKADQKKLRKLTTELREFEDKTLLFRWLRNVR